MRRRRKQKIAYVVSMPHGLEAWTYREIESLVASDIDVTIFALKYALGPYMPKPDWDCYRLDKWSIIRGQIHLLAKRPRIFFALLFESFGTRSLIDFLISASFSQQMSRRRVGMVHCVFGDHKLFVGYYCKKILEIPLSVALYGYDLRANPNWSMFRRAIASCDSIVVNCNFNRDLLLEIVGNEVIARVKVIRHHAKIPVDDANRKIRVLIVGGFNKRKGHDLLFQAVGSLGDRGSCIEVWVAGYPGPVDMRKLARDAGVETQVKIFESVPDQILALLYEKCDLFCLPSITDDEGVSEGLPVALIEAMAHAKPVVATGLAGTPELVEEILVEEGDIEGLAQAIIRFTEDPVLRESSGARNREIVKARYSERNLDEMRNLFIGAQAN